MLSKLQTMKEEREQGFTLIELLVVILIIGILSAIAIPAFMNQRKSAVDSSVQSDVSNAAKQIETWVVKQGSTVTDIPGDPVTITSAANGFSTLTDADKGSAALKSIKVSDGTELVIEGTSFDYKITGTNEGGDVADNGTGFVYNSATGGFAK